MSDPTRLSRKVELGAPHIFGKTPNLLFFFVQVPCGVVGPVIYVPLDSQRGGEQLLRPRKGRGISTILGGAAP